MPAIDPTYRPRVWRCDECRNILGVVLRDVNRVRRLWVLRIQTPDEEFVLSNEVGILASAQSPRHAHLGPWSVHGMDAGFVGCDICGAIQEWRISTEAMKDMLESARGDAGVKEFNRLAKGGGA